MLHEEPTKKREQISLVCIDELVPQNHLLRKIDRVIDWSFIYDLVKEKYSPDFGRPSIDPVILIKIVLIQYLYGIRSMRQTIREIEVNLAYMKRFLTFQPLERTIPDDSKELTCSSRYSQGSYRNVLMQVWLIRVKCLLTPPM